jgi:hypothetical protein
MTYAEAMEVRLRHAQRQPVDPADLELANRVVKAVRQMQADMPEPEPVAPAATKKEPFPAERILVRPTEPLPKAITVLLQPAARPVLANSRDDEQVNLLWAQLNATKRSAAGPPKKAEKPQAESIDRTTAGPWKSVTAMVLTHDRKSLALGQMHKVPVQAIDFYP